MTRHTYHCESIDQAMSYLEAFQSGGWSGLRDYIKNERTQQMQQKQYEAKDEISLWSRDDAPRVLFTGGGKTTDFDGKEVRSAVLVVRDRLFDGGPVADLYWYTQDGAYAAAIFKKADGKISGQIDTHWVNVFDNRDREKGPAFRVKFNVKEARTPAAVGADDDYPPF